jgi:hypothetical protein
VWSECVSKLDNTLLLIKYFTCGWLCLFRGTAVREHDFVERDTFETSSSVLKHASNMGALTAGLAGMNLANLIICAIASSNGHHQARRSTTYTLQLEKIHCRIYHQTHQSFPYSQSHSKFVPAYRFYPPQNIDTDIRGHFRGYPYPRRSSPITTAWLVLKLLIKKTAPDVEGTCK